MPVYRIEIDADRPHQFNVTLTVKSPQARQRVALPVWIPGSYMVREFARHLSGMSARQGQREVQPRQLDKTSWEFDCQGTAALVLSYQVYAFDRSVRTAFLDADRGFFNATSLCLRVAGQEAQGHELELRGLREGWSVASAMECRKANRQYVASNYDEMADHPFELGRFWRGRFLAHGVVHEFVVAGSLPSFDGEKLLADTQRICEAEIRFWHGEHGASPNLSQGRPKRGESPLGGQERSDVGVPFQKYVFMLAVFEDGYGGLEHRASTALIAKRHDLPRLGQVGVSEGYATLLGLISHEYFHTWNVKRLRPAEFASYDYERENYTELLWFFEGFTSYYEDLFLVRTGLIDHARYLGLLARTINGVQATPGQRVQSVAQASFDAWGKYYRPDENTPNLTVSYYNKGLLIAVALDLSLRSRGKHSLDDVMRELYRRSAGGPVTQADIFAVVKALGSTVIANQLHQWVHERAELDLCELLNKFGIRSAAESANMGQRLGLKASESALTGVQIKQVLNDSAAQRAGLNAGDELLACNDWRLRRLDEMPVLVNAKPGQDVSLLVVRDQRLLSLTLTWPAADTGAPVALKIQPDAGARAQTLRNAWLG